MTSCIENLTKILEDELQVHLSLTSSAQSMNDAIKARDAAAVQRVSAQYDQLVGQLEHLEERRLSLCDGAAAELGIPARHVNVSRIINKLTDPAMKQKLESIRDSLKKKIGELSQLNYCNRIMLEEELRVIARTFQLATRVQQTPVVYQKQGRRDTKTVNRSLINTIA